jgi:photosystem II stability/assembly factor-like uncharacterized protein
MRAIPWSLSAGALFALFPFAAPAGAQWTRVPQVPASDVFSVAATGDTLAAGQDSTVSLSTDGGVTWRRSATVAPGLFSIDSVLVHNGRLHAGTDRQGVFVSDDLGVSWTGYSQGLVGLGSLATAELISDGDNLYLATIGGSAWVRNLAAGP